MLQNKILVTQMKLRKSSTFDLQPSTIECTTQPKIRNKPNTRPPTCKTKKNLHPSFKNQSLSLLYTPIRPPPCSNPHTAALRSSPLRPLPSHIAPNSHHFKTSLCPFQHSSSSLLEPTAHTPSPPQTTLTFLNHNNLLHHCTPSSATGAHHNHQ